jgi:FAD/FMN-containing dehydrogenase
VIAIVRLLASLGVSWVPRGAGTGLSGGALAEGAVLLGLHRLKRIISIDAENRVAVVEPGVVNASLSRATASYGLHYAPDPSSQAACTIGGNVAENAGGPHCLKYGVTMNHVVALTVVLPDGTVTTLGSADGEAGGYDLVGTFVGSEGCFGVALDATVRLTKNPEADPHAAGGFQFDRRGRAGSLRDRRDRDRARGARDDGSGDHCAREASIYAAGYPRRCGACC